MPFTIRNVRPVIKAFRSLTRARVFACPADQELQVARGSPVSDRSIPARSMQPCTYRAGASYRRRFTTDSMIPSPPDWTGQTGLPEAMGYTPRFALN